MAIAGEYSNADPESNPVIDTGLLGDDQSPAPPDPNDSGEAKPEAVPRYGGSTKSKWFKDAKARNRKDDSELRNNAKRWGTTASKDVDNLSLESSHICLIADNAPSTNICYKYNNSNIRLHIFTNKIYQYYYYHCKLAIESKI